MSQLRGILTSSFIEQKVVRLMNEEVQSVATDTSMDEVIEILREENCGTVIVENENDEVLGILSERDVLLKPIDWEKSTAKDIMTPSPQVIRKTGSIARALHMMSIGGYRHLPVVHRQRYVEGMLSVKDVVAHIYGLLLKHHIGEQCERVGDKKPIQKYFCSTVEIFKLETPSLMSASASVHDVLQVLKTMKSGAIMLVDEAKQLLGIFTDRDFIQNVAGKPMDRKAVPISTYMTENPIFASPHETVHEVYHKLSDGGFRHLPIVDEGKILGMLSIKDFLDVLVRELLEELEKSK